MPLPPAPPAALPERHQHHTHPTWHCLPARLHLAGKKTGGRVRSQSTWESEEGMSGRPSVAPAIDDARPAKNGDAKAKKRTEQMEAVQDAAELM